MTDGHGTTGGEPSAGAWAGRTIHFVGVGGAGMSAYARVAYELGARVSGSDCASSPFLERLHADGVLVPAIGHAAANVPRGEDVEVVHSSAVSAENPERREARERGLRERSRAELLAELSALKRTVAVAGTHGKSTTASMLAWALLGAGMQPGWLVGAEIGGGLPNGRWGAGEWLVIEADESDRSMLALTIEIALLTNVELDHADAFGSLAELRESFGELLAKAPLAVVWNRPELLALRTGPVVAYDAPAPCLSAQGTRFEWRGHEVRLAVPGAHNAIDASGALEAARLAGAPEHAAVAALASFPGAGRRFQRLGVARSGAAIYEDYAHHPTEIEATLAAARLVLDAHDPANDGPGRVVAVFQPHLFSRTRALAGALGRALAHADVAAVLDIYPARERAEDHPGVSGLLVAQAAAQAASGRPVWWLPGFDEAARVIEGLLDADDVCVVMGAGDVNTLARRLVHERSAPSPRVGAAGTSGRGAKQL
jgi:UDP-N-acetylmuramate--alanine ligase